MGVIISRPGIYLPPDILYNSDLEKMVDTSDEWIRERSGIATRRISFDKGVVEMGIEAAKDLENKLGIKLKDIGIDMVLVATNKHDKGISFPQHAAKIAEALEIDNAWYEDRFAGCSGDVGNIISARNEILSGDVKKILLIAGDHLTSMTDYSNRNTCILFGDAGVAKIIQSSDYKGIYAGYRCGSFDAGDKQKPEWKDGFLRLEPKQGMRLSKDDEGKFILKSVAQNYMGMEGREIFKFAVKAMEKAIFEVLKKADMTLDDIDYIVPHNANLRIIDNTNSSLVKKGFKGLMLQNVAMYANTSTASTALTENYFIEQKVLVDGQIGLYVVFGAGKNYGAYIKRNTYDVNLFKK